MNIDGFIQTGISEFEIDVKERYADPDLADKVWKLAELIAQRLHKDVEGLIASDGSSWSELRVALAAHELDEDLELALQARLAWHLQPSFKDAATRCWQLAELLPRAAPPQVVKRFLTRVARCYLLDFVPECLVMCRAALENGINARYRVEKVPFPRNAEGVETMRLKLAAAKEAGWLKSISVDALHADVWLRGSKAAHGDPLAVGDALGAIRLTVQALEGLNPPPLPE